VKALIALIFLLPLAALGQVTVATQCPKHHWKGKPGENCPYCVAEARRSATSSRATPDATPTPAVPGLSPAAQATTDVLSRGISSIFDALLNSPPAPDPQRQRQEQLQAEQARAEEQQRHERLLSNLKLSGGSGASASTETPANPLGLKLGKSAQEEPDTPNDGLHPAGTALFGLGGGGGSPVTGTSTDAVTNAQAPGAPGANTSAGDQLISATNGLANGVFDGSGARGQGSLRRLNLKGIPAAIRENPKFIELNEKRDASVARAEQLQSQIGSLNAKLAKGGADAPVLRSQIKNLESQKDQSESYTKFADKEIKRQFNINVDEQ